MKWDLENFIVKIGYYLYFTEAVVWTCSCNFVKKRSSGAGVFRWILQNFQERHFLKILILSLSIRYKRLVNAKNETRKESRKKEGKQWNNPFFSKIVSIRIYLNQRGFHKFTFYNFSSSWWIVLYCVLYNISVQNKLWKVGDIYFQKDIKNK